MTKKNNYKRKRSTRKNSNFKKKRTLKKHYKQNIKIRGGESNSQDTYVQQHIHNNDQQHSNSDCHDVHQLNKLIEEYITANENSLIYPQVLEDISPNMLVDLINKMKVEVDNISSCIQENTTYLEANKNHLLDILKNAAKAGLTEIVEKVVNDNSFSSFKEALKQYATEMTTNNPDGENASITAANQAISNAAQEAMEQAQKDLKQAQKEISALKEKDLEVANKNIKIYYEALTQKYTNINRFLNSIII